MEAYRTWIQEYVAREGGILLGKCVRACAEMRRVFPELEEVRGHVTALHWGKRGHAWLKSPDGKIVDPTAAQFPTIILYEPWKPGDEVRVGACMECGNDIWKAVDSLDQDHSVYSSFCSSECEETYIREVEGG